MRRAGSAVTLKKNPEVRWEQGEEVEMEMSTLRSSLFSSLDSSGGGEREFFPPSTDAGKRLRKASSTVGLFCVHHDFPS